LRHRPQIELGSVGPLAIASRGGQAVDWADGTPRDHFLDTGVRSIVPYSPRAVFATRTETTQAVLTASTTFIGSEPRDAAETATA